MLPTQPVDNVCWPRMTTDSLQLPENAIWKEFSLQHKSGLSVY